jgi:outer membrane lipoprotein-sorting protein
MNSRTHNQRRACSLVLVGVFFLGAAAAQAGNAGYDIMKQANERPAGDDMTTTVLMKIVSKSGNVKTREFTMYQLHQKDGASSTLIKFLQPADVKGTSFLTTESSKGEKSQYIYLPSLKKATRISASDKNKPFMGSDLTYDDFGSRNVDEYTFSMPGDETLAGRACWKIESTPKDKSGGTSKIVSLVDKESLLIVKADFYDKSGTLYKQMTVSQSAKISGIWTMVELEMKNLTTGSSTSLRFDAVKYDTGLPTSLFSKESLGK